MTEQKTIPLRSEAQAEYAKQLIDKLPKDMDKPRWAVVLERYQKSRSTQQNRLYWKWISIIGEAKPERIVMTKDKWHYAFAIMFLDPIEVPDLKTGELRVCPRSTQSLNTNEFTDYLTQIEAWSAERGIILPHPQDMGYTL